MKQTLKRMLSVTLALVLLCSLLPVSTLAATPTSGKCGDNAYWEYDEATKTLTISGDGGIDNYADGNSPPWLYGFPKDSDDYGRGIEKVIIEEGITFIGYNSFSYCRYLVELYIPISVASIYDGAIYGYGVENLSNVYYAGNKEQWYNIAGIDIVMEEFEEHGTVVHYEQDTESEFVSQCGDNAYWEFDESTGTLSINGKGSMWDYEGFSGRPWSKLEKSIKNLVIKDGITRIGDYAFSWHDLIENVTFSDSLEFIGHNAFFGCSGLKSVELPTILTSIESSTFGWCDNLKAITIPDNVTFIDAYAFFRCEVLSDVYFTGTKAQWEAIEIGENNEPLTKLTPVFNYGKEPEAKPSGKCGDNAYWEYDTATKTLTISGTGALWDYDGVKDPGWEDYLRDWERDEPRVEKIVIEKGITKIGNSTFAQVWIYDISLPEGLLEIGNRAFWACSTLEEIILPQSLTLIGYSAFEWAGLKSIDVPANVKSIGSHAFSLGLSPEEATLKKITLHEGLESIGEFAFHMCPITEIDLPNSVTSIGQGAFFGTDLSSVTIPQNMTILPENLFWGCYLDSVVIHDGVTKIGDGAFEHCDELSEVFFTGSKEQWLDIEIGDNNTPLLAADITYGVESEDDSDNTFRDVKESDWFYNAVMWAVENGITGGVAPNTFGPNDSCTRAQVVTFLWAAAGKPEPTSTDNPFNDVKRSDWFYKAVLWAVENGITSGIRPGEFGPNETCTRAQVVTFLYASEGKPYVVALDGAFKDVGYKDWFKEEVQWAVNYGVTGGIGNGMFGPNNTCTRGQVVTFLYKADQIDPNGYEASPLNREKCIARNSDYGYGEKPKVASDGEWLYYYDSSSGNIMKMKETDFSEKQVITYIGKEEILTIYLGDDADIYNVDKEGLVVENFYHFDGYLYFELVIPIHKNDSISVNTVFYRIKDGTNYIEKCNDLSLYCKFEGGNSPSNSIVGDLDVIYTYDETHTFYKYEEQKDSKPIQELFELQEGGTYYFKGYETPEIFTKMCEIEEAKNFLKVRSFAGNIYVMGNNQQGKLAVWLISDDGNSVKSIDCETFVASWSEIMSRYSWQYNDDYIVFLREVDNDLGQIWVSSYDLSEQTALDSCLVMVDNALTPTDEFAITNDYIFFINENNNLCRVNFDGSEKVILSLMEVDTLNAQYDWLYFKTLDGECYRTSFDGKTVDPVDLT